MNINWHSRFNPIISIFMLLGMVLIVTGVWYAAYRAGAIANAWSSQSAEVIQ